MLPETGRFGERIVIRAAKPLESVNGRTGCPALREDYRQKFQHGDTETQRHNPLTYRLRAVSLCLRVSVLNCPDFYCAPKRLRYSSEVMKALTISAAM